MSFVSTNMPALGAACSASPAANAQAVDTRKVFAMAALVGNKDDDTVQHFAVEQGHPNKGLEAE